MYTIFTNSVRKMDSPSVNKLRKRRKIITKKIKDKSFKKNVGVNTNYSLILYFGPILFYKHLRSDLHIRYTCTGEFKNYIYISFY